MASHSVCRYARLRGVVRLQLEARRHRGMVGGEVSRPLAGVVPDGREPVPDRREPVPEIHVAVCVGELTLAVITNREEFNGGDDLVDKFRASALYAGEPTLLGDTRGEVEEADVVPLVRPPEPWRADLASGRTGEYEGGLRLGHVV